MKRILLLSGTPMLSRPSELFNLLKIIRPDIFYNFLEYAYRYCRPKETSYGMDYGGNAHTKELHCLLEKKLMIRRLKSEVLSELPSKRRTKIEVTTDPKIVMQIKAILCREVKSKSKEKRKF
jgi:SWI/SNF-related matrix-associated actin-dependent regulator of chromatin subfamily A-like protein 1